MEEEGGAGEEVEEVRLYTTSMSQNITHNDKRERRGERRKREDVEGYKQAIPRRGPPK